MVSENQFLPSEMSSRDIEAKNLDNFIKRDCLSDGAVFICKERISGRFLLEMFSLTMLIDFWTCFGVDRIGEAVKSTHTVPVSLVRLFICIGKNLANVSDR